jgi:hypothetical protein
MPPELALCDILEHLPLAFMSSAYRHCWLCVLLPIALPAAKVFLSPHQDPCQTVGSGVVVQLALHKSVRFVLFIYQEKTLAR